MRYQHHYTNLICYVNDTIRFFNEKYLYLSKVSDHILNNGYNSYSEAVNEFGYIYSVIKNPSFRELLKLEREAELTFTPSVVEKNKKINNYLKTAFDKLEALNWYIKDLNAVFNSVLEMDYTENIRNKLSDIREELRDIFSELNNTAFAKIEKELFDSYKDHTKILRNEN